MRNHLFSSSKFLYERIALHIGSLPYYLFNPIPTFYFSLLFFFHLQLGEVKRLRVRLDHIYFMRQFDELINEIKPDISSVTAACQDIIKGSRFVLKIYYCSMN